MKLDEAERMRGDSSPDILAIRAAACDFDGLLDDVESAATEHWRTSEAGILERKWYAAMLAAARSESDGVVAVRNGKARGFVVFHLDGSEGILDALYVHRGENRRLIAHKLLATAVSQLEQHAGLESIENRFFTWPDDYISEPLQALGFTVVQRADMALTLSEWAQTSKCLSSGYGIMPLGDSKFAEIVRCVHASYQHGEDPVYAPDELTPEGTEAKIKWLLEDSVDRYSFATTQGSELVGVIIVCRYGKDDAEYSLVIQQVCVVPEHRGQGIGAALLERALKKMQSAGEKRVWLTVTLSNEPALRSYEKHGFRVKNRVPYGKWTRA